MLGTNDPSSRLVEHLSSTSTPYIDPLARVPWDRMERRAFWLPETAVSLFGWAEFMSLPEDQRRMLSRHEFMHLLVTVQRFETVFIERVSRVMQRPGEPLSHANYRLHMAREHIGHGLMMLELLRRSGLQRSRGYVATHLSRFIARHSALHSAAFWTVMYAGEEIVNRVFRGLRKNHAGLCPVIDEMVRIHLVDASRHLSHAHDNLENALNVMPRWRMRLMRFVVRRVFREQVNSLFYPPPSVYESAGLYPGEYWAKIARENPHRTRFVQQNVGTTLRPFKKRGLHVS